MVDGPDPAVLRVMRNTTIEFLVSLAENHYTRGTNVARLIPYLMAHVTVGAL